MFFRRRNDFMVPPEIRILRMMPVHGGIINDKREIALMTLIRKHSEHIGADKACS